MPEHEIIVGVTGGIAAYKTAQLVSLLAQSDYGVRVVMTESAQEFVGPATFAALSGRPVVTDLFSGADHPLGAHIELARRADLLCVAPASANFVGKVAGGLADDLLTTLMMCFTGPVILAPAMNVEMWEKPVVQRNLETLRNDGLQIIDPESGWLSCRVQGKGRMAEAQDLFDAITAVVDPTSATNPRL